MLSPQLSSHESYYGNIGFIGSRTEAPVKFVNFAAEYCNVVQGMYLFDKYQKVLGEVISLLLVNTVYLVMHFLLWYLTRTMQSYLLQAVT